MTGHQYIVTQLDQYWVNSVYKFHQIFSEVLR